MIEVILRKSALSALLVMALGGTHVYAATLQEAASQTVLTNPEVTSKWRSFRASIFERDVAWGRNLPTLDVLYGVARQSRTPPDRTATVQNRKVTLKQNLFEGFATLNDTKRLEHATMVRYWEVLGASETAAYEASKAYIDVWRYRQLVAYAKENVQSHLVAYEKLKKKAEAGVIEKADFDTVQGRLALARQNLLTEQANLHDVSARYQRIVGELPPENMSPPPEALSGGLPANVTDAINNGFENSPRLHAAFENILSAKRNVEVNKSGYMPRVDAIAEMVRDRNVAGANGSVAENTLGVTMSWNLFRGFQDKNKAAKAVEEVYYAKDIREKECREVRQDLSTSFNEFHRLGKQLKFQEMHRNSANKVREAFDAQFNIRKRTLLDVLDAENEYYTSRRGYLNSEMDRMVANARYLSTAGELLNVLDLENLDMTPPNPQTQADDDMFTTCPAEAAEMPNYNDEDQPLPPLPAPAPAPEPVFVPPPVPPTVQKYIQTQKPVVIYGANFDFDSDKLRPEADEKLQTVVDFSKDFPMADIDVIGHTDWVASDEYNLDLSRRRSEAVKKWLIKKGVPADRISVKFKGEAEPIATNETKEGRAQNRRVEVHYTVTEKMDPSKM